MSKKSVYYAPGLTPTSVNQKVHIRITHSEFGPTNTVELVQGRRAFAEVPLYSGNLDGTSPSSVAYRRRVDKLAVALNMKVESNIPELSTHPVAV